MTDDIGGRAAICATGVRKTFLGGDGSTLEVLKGVELNVEAGETVAIIGASGSGKSTLLHILGALDKPSAGEVWIGGEAVHLLKEDAVGRLRNGRIGFVFQFHHLMREFTVLENVMMPQLIAGRSRSAAAERALELLRDVGLEARLEHKPMQLSGGEQQRVAVARALANQPLALMADEPTGNLDPGSSGRLHDLLFSISARHGTAMVLVTHNMELAARSDRILAMHDGVLVPADLTTFEYPKRSAV